MESLKISKKEFEKMNFIMNTIEDGWSVRKINDEYIFKRKHDGKREVFRKEYLDEFIYKNMKLN
jgi:hypothetical protein